MLTTLTVLAPVAAGFGAGAVLRRTGVAGPREGDFLFLLNLYVCMPALVFTALSQVRMSGGLVVFPLAALAMVVVGFLCGRGVVGLRGMAPRQAAVVVMGFMIVNAAFTLPFAQALYGEEGVARIAAFDAVNSILALTAGYAVAAGANPAHRGHGLLLGRALRMPPLYAVVLGVLVNVTGVEVPGVVTTTISPFAAATPVLIAVGTGILFRPLRDHLRRAGRLTLSRLPVLPAVGAAIVLVLGLEGADRGVLLLLSVAPLAFFTVTFASLEDLDVDLAAQTLAVSLPVTFVLSMALSLWLG